MDKVESFDSETDNILRGINEDAYVFHYSPISEADVNDDSVDELMRGIEEDVFLNHASALDKTNVESEMEMDEVIVTGCGDAEMFFEARRARALEEEANRMEQELSAPEHVSSSFSSSTHCDLITHMMGNFDACAMRGVEVRELREEVRRIRTSHGIVDEEVRVVIYFFKLLIKMYYYLTYYIIRIKLLYFFTFKHLIKSIIICSYIFKLIYSHVSQN